MGKSLRDLMREHNSGAVGAGLLPGLEEGEIGSTSGGAEDSGGSVADLIRTTLGGGAVGPATGVFGTAQGDTAENSAVTMACSAMAGHGVSDAKRGVSPNASAWMAGVEGFSPAQIQYVTDCYMTAYNANKGATAQQPTCKPEAGVCAGNSECCSGLVCSGGKCTAAVAGDNVDAAKETSPWWYLALGGIVGAVGLGVAYVATRK